MQPSHVALLMISTMSAAALLTAGPRPRRAAGLTLALCALGLPWLASPAPLPRAFLALGTAWCLARVIDLFRARRPLSAGRRLWHVFAILDTRQLRPAPPRLDLRAAVKIAGYGLVAAAGLLLALDLSPRLGGPLHFITRWLGAALLLYGGADSIEALSRVVYHGIGLFGPRIHHVPVASRSLQEFWARRWNLTVSRWLYAHCYRPLAARGRATAGEAAAFFVSALLHAYFTLAAVGWLMAALMGSFFLLHGGLVLTERRLGISRWRPVPAHAWVVTTFLLTLPLLAEPLVRMLRTQG